jgi:hypothetical protein
LVWLFPKKPSLDALDIHPVEFLANFFPHLVLLVELFAALEQMKGLFEVVETQEFDKLVEDVAVAEKVFAGGRANFHKGRLNLLEHVPELVFHFLANNGHLFVELI